MSTCGCYKCQAGTGCIRSLSFNRSSLRVYGHWDPVVGDYVASEGEFRSKLARGVEAQSEKLGMDAKVETVDARDHSALAELHGHDVDERKELRDRTAHAKKAGV